MAADYQWNKNLKTVTGIGVPFVYVLLSLGNE